MRLVSIPKKLQGLLRPHSPNPIVKNEYLSPLPVVELGPAIY